ALPPASSRPYGHGFDEVADACEGALEEQGLDPARVIGKPVVDPAALTFHIAREHLLTAVRTLRDDPALRHELCPGVSGVHYPHDSGRELHAAYQLPPTTHGRR
ncbi:NADH dehydrogenase, partial [Saccharothrix sp. ST-888]